MQAVILAGGEGKRLRALLGEIPKCLAEVKGKPFIEHQIGLLKSHGILEFVLCVGVGADRVARALGDGKKLGVSIAYSYEKKRLGTAGAIREASALIEGRFLCANGDTLCEFSLADMEERHRSLAALATIVYRRGDATGKGTIRIGAGGEILGFEEKSLIDREAFVNCGFYLMEREILEHIPREVEVSLEKAVFPTLLSSGYRISAFPSQGAFVDIGTPEDYLRVREKGWRE